MTELGITLLHKLLLYKSLKWGGKKKKGTF